MSLKNEQLERFRAAIEGISGDLVIVVAQVDPDALASAIGLRKIIEHLRPELSNRIRIVYCGHLSHPQNRALINRFDLGRVLIPAKDFGFNPSSVDKIALVDSSSLNESRLPENFRQLKPTIVVDHHKANLPEPTEDQFFWSETTHVGSASTMVTELAAALKVSFNQEENLLLAVGIHTDTKALVDGHRRDHEAFSLVSKDFSGREFGSLINFPLPPSFYRNLDYALSHMEQEDGRLVVNVGQVQPDAADDISTIAEELVRMEGVALVVVFGLIGKSVRISARSTNATMELDTFLKECFGQDNAGAKLTQDGRGEGGATIKLDLGIWMSDGVRAEAEALFFARIKELIFVPEK